MRPSGPNGAHGALCGGCSVQTREVGSGRHGLYGLTQRFLPPTIV